MGNADKDSSIKEIKWNKASDPRGAGKDQDVSRMISCLNSSERILQPLLQKTLTPIVSIILLIQRKVYYLIIRYLVCRSLYRLALSATEYVERISY